MSTLQWSRGKGYVAVGAVGVFLSTIYLALSLQFPFGTMRQPGAAIFPLISGGFFLLGSISAIFEGLRTSHSEKVEVPAGSDFFRLCLVIVSLIGYLVLLPWLGQLLSSALFSYVMIKTLSTLGRFRIAVYAIVISVSVYILFVKLLKLPLPLGIIYF